MRSDFTLLMFDWDDSVSVVQTLRTGSRADALRMADLMSSAYPGLAGYQLWQRGERVAATFPDTRHMALRASA